jgi:hypothetical protein
MSKKTGVVALNTLPDLNSRREKAEAELIDLKTALREIIRVEQQLPREILQGKSYVDTIKAKRVFIESLDVEIRNRMRTPNQIVFDFDGDLFGDLLDDKDAES